MPTTELSLEISRDTLPKVLRVFDTSFYAPGAGIQGYVVGVLPVGKNAWTNFNVGKRFSLVLNAVNLGYGVGADTDLPDGIYEFTQAYTPTADTTVHYYHLRVATLRDTLRQARARLLDTSCQLSREEFALNRDQLREIEEYIDGAVYKVEECGDKAVGKELYEWAQSLLTDYNHACNCQ